MDKIYQKCEKCGVIYEATVPVRPHAYCIMPDCGGKAPFDPAKQEDLKQEYFCLTRLKVGTLFRQKNGNIIRITHVWNNAGDCSFVHHLPDGRQCVDERWGCTEKRDIITPNNTLLRLSKEKPFKLELIRTPYYLEEYETGNVWTKIAQRIVFK